MAVLIEQRLVGLSKQLKQIIQIEHNIGNPNSPKAHQLAICKRSRAFELWATEKQIQVVARVGLKCRTAGLQVRCTDHSERVPSLAYKTLYNAQKTTETF